MDQLTQHLPIVRMLKGICLTTLIFCSSFAYSQSALNILDLYHESFPDKKALTITASAHIGDNDFHSNVGGVSFQAVASPAENLKNQNISLDFIDNRLVVKIGTKTLYPALPFWQLAPIVNYVNSSYNVIVSQLGDTTGNKEAQCRFHPAFLDNLLGLRLFQADLLNMADILWDIPVDAQRHYILAASEQRYTPAVDTTIRRQIYDKLASGGFTSFALTDRGVNVVFDMDESGLKFSGDPYYYFTKTLVDTATIGSLKTQLSSCYNDIETNAKLLLKNGYTSDLNPRTNLNALVKALAKNKQEDVFNPYSMHYIAVAISQLDSLNKLPDSAIGIQFQALRDYTDSFKSYWSLLKQYNPLVYSAVENTSHWSAFFRYVSRENPANWTQFVKKLQGGKWDAPAVQTPTSSDVNYFRYFEDKEKGRR